jgi:hypothetical protein
MITDDLGRSAMQNVGDHEVVTTDGAPSGARVRHNRQMSGVRPTAASYQPDAAE